MKKIDKALLFYIAFVLFAVAAMLTSPWWSAWGASTYTDKFALEMPEQGDVGWDDAIRLNHRIYEVVVGPILDGHLIETGCTPHEGEGGTTIYWDAGTVIFAGKRYDLPAGSTDYANNAAMWLSAVIDGASGATVDLRTTEYYPPSSASGFYTPLAIATSEAGSIVRFKDITYRPKTAYQMDQDVHSGATPTFQQVYVVDLVDAANINARTAVTLYGNSGASPTVVGQIAYDTDHHNLVIGDGTNTRAIPTRFSEAIFIASPDLLDDITQQPFFVNTTGVTIWFSGVTIIVPESGCTADFYAGTTIYHRNKSGASDFVRNASLSSTSGASAFVVTYNSGVSGLHPGYALIMDWGGGSTANWVEIQLTGWLEGFN